MDIQNLVKILEESPTDKIKFQSIDSVITYNVHEVWEDNENQTLNISLKEVSDE